MKHCLIKIAVLFLSAVVLSAVFLTGCAGKTVLFTIPDFLANGLSHTQSEIFSRFGYDEKAASPVEPAGSGELSAAETFSIGGVSVRPQFTFDDTGACIMLRYRVDLSGQDADSVYKALMAQSDALKEALADACNFDDPNVSEYTKFPSDTYPTADDFLSALEAVPDGSAYNRFWTWILNAYDETESVWADLMAWIPKDGKGAYLELHIYRFS